MHAERDVLVRSVFPELRRRAAAHYLYLQEVELRWGVTEEESNRAVELCLSEVCRSQLLLGILGERYGLVPPHRTLPELPQYNWVIISFIYLIDTFIKVVIQVYIVMCCTSKSVQLQV